MLRMLCRSAALLFMLSNCLALTAETAKQLRFTITITCPRTKIRIGDPIPVSISVANQTDERITLPDVRLGPQEAGVTVWDAEGKKMHPVHGTESDRVLHRMPLLVFPNKA